MPFLDLSPELLLMVASQVRQVDLLNLSLVCKHLHDVVVPELYREYSNPRLYARSFLPFIKRMIAHPEYAKQVRRVDLHDWEGLGILEVTLNEHGENRRHAIQRLREYGFSQEDYYLTTQAAKAAGVIDTIDPYEPSSRLIDIVESLDDSETVQDVGVPSWLEHIFDDQIGINEVSYDCKFCQILRAGIEDAQVVLLLALLPNIREIFLRGGPNDINILAWRASHKFESLRDLTVCGTDDELVWPLSSLNNLLSTTRKLETLRCSIASSWYRTLYEAEPDPSNVLPMTIRPHSLCYVKTLELKHCCLRLLDLRRLIQACPGLESLYYSVGTVAEGIPGPSPVMMMGILEPLKNKLRALSLDLPPGYDEDEEDPSLDSLTHMTALEILDTSAEMWKNIVDEDFELNDFQYDSDGSEGVRVADSRLYTRLPVSLKKLIFHISENGYGFEPAAMHISELIREQPRFLPNLAEVLIEPATETYDEHLREVIHEENGHLMDGPQQLEVRVGPIPPTVFDTVVHSKHQPTTKWFGAKYSTRYRKPNEMDRAIKRIGKAFEAREREGTIDDVLADDPELQAYFMDVRKAAENGEPVTYYDTDEEMEYEPTA